MSNAQENSHLKTKGRRNITVGFLLTALLSFFIVPTIATAGTPQRSRPITNTVTVTNTVTKTATITSTVTNTSTVTATVTNTVTNTAPSTVTTTVTSTVTPSSTSPTTNPSTTTTPPTTPPTTPTPAQYGVNPATILNQSGIIQADTAGTVYKDLKVTGYIIVSANNVTIKNSSIQSNTWWAIRIMPGVTGTIIDHVTVNGSGVNGASGSAGISGAASITNSDIFGVENGIVADSGPGYIGMNHIHDLVAPAGAHYDGIQMDGGQHDWVIEKNLIDLTNQTQTSAIMMDNEFGPLVRVTVQGNNLLGGAYVLYVDGKFSNINAISPTVSNNILSHGAYGDIMSRNNQATFTSNLNGITGEPASM